RDRHAALPALAHSRHCRAGRAAAVVGDAHDPSQASGRRARPPRQGATSQRQAAAAVAPAKCAAATGAGGAAAGRRPATGAELAAEARTRSGVLRVSLCGAAAALIACGVWWPGHLMPADGGWTAPTGWEPLIGWMLAFGWGACCMGAARFAHHTTLPACAAFAVTGVIASYVHAMMWSPQFFRLASAFGHGVPGLALVLATAALALLHVDSARSSLRRARVVPALMVGAMSSFIAAAAPAAPAVASWTP